MKTHVSYYAAAVVGLSLIVGPAQFRETVHAQEEQDFPVPVVFQAAGPTVASIQGMVDAFRAALGANNGNVPGPLATGRREINWDGGGSTATSLTAATFDGFLLNRGARFVTSKEGFVQATAAGLATTFNNPTYENIFQAFSPQRLFTPVGGSNFTKTLFFVPGSGVLPAATLGFGAIFTDVDLPNTTSISYHDVDGTLLFKGLVPASVGDKSVSFLGVVFHNPRVAQVRIRTRGVPGPDDAGKVDVVMMDDFIYGEPQMIN